MRGPCIYPFFTLLGTVHITEDGEGMITGVYLPCSNLPPMDEKDTDTLDEAAEQLNEYLSGKRREFDLDLRFDGSDFRSRVMEELNAIPYGEVRTYGEIAEAIGYPKSSRAVGTACAENPIPIFVPCHRVVPASGGYGNYSCGVSLKRKLLNLEGVYLDRSSQKARGDVRTGLRRIHEEAESRKGSYHRREGPEDPRTGEGDREGRLGIVPGEHTRNLRGGDAEGHRSGHSTDGP